MHVRATVAATRTTRTGYTFISLEQPGPKCPIEVAVRPELLPNLTRYLQLQPSELTGRVVLVQGVQATAKGSTAQIWLDRAPALSVAPLCPSHTRRMVWCWKSSTTFA